MSIRATARVRVTLEVEAGVWGDTCTLRQLNEQAAESALGKLRRLLNNQDAQSDGRVTIVGAPKVTGVLTNEES